MLNYNLLSLLISLLAVIIAAVSLSRTRRVQEEQIKLQKVTADLSAKQLTVLERDEKEKISADIHADLVNEGGGSYSFMISNIGSAPASNVEFDTEPSSLILGDHERKLPAPILNPHGTIKLLANIHMGSPPTFKAKASWTNPDGKQDSKEFYLTL